MSPFVIAKIYMRYLGIDLMRCGLGARVLKH